MCPTVPTSSHWKTIVFPRHFHSLSQCLEIPIARESAAVAVALPKSWNNDKDGVLVLGFADACVGGLGARTGSELGYDGHTSRAT